MLENNLTKFIVGLGNPGSKYQETRHNVGFIVLDILAKKLGITLKEEKKLHSLIGGKAIELNYATLKTIKDKALNTKTKLEEKQTLKLKLYLVKPTTYMNESGSAIQAISNFYKIKAENILIIHDDVSLKTGELKLSFNRGAGGQHGIEDTINKLGTKAFHRLRFGVGPDPGGDSRADYVLSKFPKSQKNLIEESLNSAAELALRHLTMADLQTIREFKY